MFSVSLEARADDVVGDGHAPEQGRDQDNVKDGGCERGDRDPDELGKAGKAPEAVIKTGNRKEDDAQQRINGGKLPPCHQIVTGNPGKDAVKAEPERQKVGQIHRNGVIEDKKDDDQLPMLDLFFFFCLGWFIGNSLQIIMSCVLCLRCRIVHFNGVNFDSGRFSIQADLKAITFCIQIQ